MKRVQPEGFPKRLKQCLFHQYSLISRVVIQMIDPGKEAFRMVRRTFLGWPRRGLLLFFRPLQDLIKPGLFS
jgi:hypothetical protein